MFVRKNAKEVINSMQKTEGKLQYLYSKNLVKKVRTHLCRTGLMSIERKRVRKPINLSITLFAKSERATATAQGDSPLNSLRARRGVTI